MVEITATTKKDFADVFKTARRDKMRVVWLEDNLAYCARRARGHQQYLVKLYVFDGDRVKVHCRNIEGQTCEGMRFNGLCAHAAKVILRGQKKAHRTHAEAA